MVFSPRSGRLSQAWLQHQYTAEVRAGLRLYGERKASYSLASRIEHSAFSNR